MPRTLQPPEGDPYFARVEAARLECPRCGYMDRFSVKGPHKGYKRRPGASGGPQKRVGWDPVVGAWTCPSCLLVVILGLLAWPVARGGGKGGLPRDQVPDVRQIAQLRAKSQGIWMRSALRRWRAEGANIAPACSCKPGCAYTDQRDKACPLHGDEVSQSET